MTTTLSRNEAAERLLTELQENPLAGARHSYSIVRDRLPAVIAAERRATVERIEPALDALDMALDPDHPEGHGCNVCRAADRLRAILDEEAAR